MTNDEDRTRRRFLRTSALLGMGLFAGCNAIGDTTTTPPVDETSTETPLATARTGTGTPTPGEVVTGTPTPGETVTDTPSLETPVEDYLMSWLGDTGDAHGADDRTHVQTNTIKGIDVTANGGVFTNCYWDEGGNEATVYHDGEIIGVCDDLHGWGRSGGNDVATDDQYAYVSMGWGNTGNWTDSRWDGEQLPEPGEEWFGVKRYDRTDYSAAPFDGGGGFLGNVLFVSENGDDIRGLAHHDGELFVSDPAGPRIAVYDTDSMSWVRDLEIYDGERTGHPEKLAVDDAGRLHVIEGRADADEPAYVIKAYDRQGRTQGTTIPADELTAPTDLTFDESGRLLVAENGPRQQVLRFSVDGDSASLVDTIGSTGGVYQGESRRYGPDRLVGPSGVDVDGEGNVYVGAAGIRSVREGLDGLENPGGATNHHAGQADVRKFTATGDPAWAALGLCYVDTAAPDPADPTRWYTADHRFDLDYALAVPGSEWGNSPFENTTMTLDPLAYPDDPRLVFWQPTPIAVRHVQGETLLFSTNMTTDYLSIHRFDGDTAVPAALFLEDRRNRIHSSDYSLPRDVLPDAGSGWLWRDENGDGAFQQAEFEEIPPLGWGVAVDANAGVWHTTETGPIRHYPLDDLEDGVPVYDRTRARAFDIPAPFTKLRRVHYDVEADTLYVSGYTADRPDDVGFDWKAMGKVLARYDDWMSSDRTETWRINLQVGEKTGRHAKETPQSFDIAGGLVFVVRSNTGAVKLFDAGTGEQVGTLRPDPELLSGLIDVTHAVRAIRRDNGEYVVAVEEDWHGKIILYRFA